MAGGDWLGLAGAELSKRMTMAYRMRQGSADVPQYRRRQYAYRTRGTSNQPAAHGNAHAPANGQRKRLYSYSVESAE